MISFRNNKKTGEAAGRKRRSALRRMFRSRDGAAAIEFAILAIPYFVIIFAILETFVAYSAEQLVSNAVDTMSRDLRTGRLTAGLGRTTDKTEKEFRQLFCNEISIMITCDTNEISTPNKLYLDIRSFSTFAGIPTSIPRVSADAHADIDTSTFKYSPGGAKSINMFRAYYRWKVITDLVRPYITNVRPANGSMPTDFLIVATAAYQNEDYP